MKRVSDGLYPLTKSNWDILEAVSKYFQPPTRACHALANHLFLTLLLLVAGSKGRDERLPFLNGRRRAIGNIICSIAVTSAVSLFLYGEGVRACLYYSRCPYAGLFPHSAGKINMRQVSNIHFIARWALRVPQPSGLHGHLGFYHHVCHNRNRVSGCVHHLVHRRCDLPLNLGRLTYRLTPTGIIIV